MLKYINYGIDLGTTNSCIACWHNDEIKTFQNNDQMNVTPSAVYISRSGRIIVGRKAYDSLEVDPDNVAINFKRLMGHRCDFKFPTSKRTMLPEELSAEILKSLLSDVNRRIGENVDQAVITVPAAFGTLQCESTLMAAKLAGLKHSPLIQEPIAAALGYGVTPDHRNQRWIVFDLGGGTLDVAVVSTRDGRLSIVEHKGNNFLGGKDIDKVIVDQYILPRLVQEYNLPQGEGYDRIYKGLMRLSESVKIALSTSEQVHLCDYYTELGMDSDGRPIEIDSHIVLTRSQLENEMQPFVDTCVSVVREAVKASRLSIDDINKVLLVGGPTNMPVIRRALVDNICPRIDYSFDPMTVVARGAAVFASSIELTNTQEDGKVNLSVSEKVHSSNEEAIAVKLEYDPTTAITKNIVAGMFDANSQRSPKEVMIEAKGGIWTSGWMAVSAENGYFEIPIIVPEAKTTTYLISARDNLGRLITVSPNEFKIKHVVIASTSPIIPQTLYVEVVRSDGSRGLDPVITRGTSLPAQNTVHYKADRTLRPSDPSASLAIKLWEGDSNNDPEANTWVGNIHIRSILLDRPIPEGAVLEVHVEMDTSRHILVEIYVPYLNQYFSDRVFVAENELSNPMDQADTLPDEIEKHQLRLNDLKNNLPENAGQDIYKEIKEIEKDIESVDIETGKIFGKGLYSASDYDSVAKTLADSRKIRASLARIESKLGIDRMQVARVEELEKLIEATKAAIEEFGIDQDKKEFSLIVRDIDIALKEKNQKGLSRTYEMLEGLRWKVLFRQDWFWAEMFKALKQSESGFINLSEAERWIIRGDQAVRNENYLELREVVRNLWKLQKPDVLALERERAMPSGLRKS